MGHLVTGRDQARQAGLAFHEPMLVGPEPPVVLHTPSEHTQDESLLQHKVSSTWGQAWEEPSHVLMHSKLQVLLAQEVHSLVL